MNRARAIVIVGVACRFPDAPNVAALWANVLARRTSAREVRAGEWPLAQDVVVDPRGSPDHAVGRSVCLLDDEDDLSGLDLPADLLRRLSRLSRVTLQVGRDAWRSLRGRTSPLRTSVILANIALPTDGASAFAESVFFGADDARAAGGHRAAEFEPLDAFPGALPAGLLCRALGLGGGSFTLDAACASSLYALHLACGDLEAGRVDCVVAGGVSLPQSLYTQIGFSQLSALSARGRCAPYDLSADGLVVGEGAGVVVLKRLDDAVREGDRILAVVRGIGLSNDVGGSLLAPEREGQLRAMRAAYLEAGWAAHDVDLIEGHGTGTPRGDAVELESLGELWREVHDRECVLGSVKSNIGHALTAAGIAGVCKVLAAIEAKVLPPTAQFHAAAAGLRSSPFRVLEAPRVWSRRADGVPRRAAVSSFGFGGINAHLLLEEPCKVQVAATTRRPSTPSDGAVPIAVVGMAVHVGRLDSLRAFQHAVMRGEAPSDAPTDERWRRLGDRDARIARLRHIEGAFIDSFDLETSRWKLPPADIDSILPQQLLMLKVAADAVLDAGGLGGPDRRRIGAIIGIGLDLESTSFHLRWLAHQRVRRWAEGRSVMLGASDLDAWAREVGDALAHPLNATRTLGALGGIVPSRIAREFRLGGPSFAVQADLSAGLRALEVAVRMLQRGEVDAMLAGAVDLAGDVRNVLAADALRPFSASGSTRPFDARADGRKLAEGAGAVVLKRLDDALAAGDRVYAVVRGIGAACGRALDHGATRQAAYVTAARAAYAEASLVPTDVSLVATHGSGAPDEDADEAAALRELFATGEPGSARTALASTAGTIGQAGAAASMLSFVSAALCLSEEVLPPLHEFETPTPAIEWSKTPFHLPRIAEAWVRDRADGPRRAAVASMGLDGSSMHVVLEGHDALHRPVTAPPQGERNHALFLLHGEDNGRAASSRLRALSDDAASIEPLAERWHREHHAGPVARAIVAATILDLHRQLDRPPERPTSSAGGIAFVFPGSGNHYVGMGRTLALALPEVYRRLDQEVRYLRGHLSPRWAIPRRTDWGPGWEDDAMRAFLEHPERAIVAQVAHGIAVSDALAYLGVRPTAFIGYSLGESAALFASRAWRDRDDMFARTLASPLFKTELAGPRTVLRDAWGDGADWTVVIATRSAASVRSALVGRASLLIVNAPNECVIGGPSRDVNATVAAMGCDAIPIDGVPSVHLPVVRAVRDAYRELHRLPTYPPSGVRFYNGARARSYEPTTESAADSIVDNAIHGFDFPAVIEQAWSDGFRVFVEAGPQASCTRMISRILEGRPHVAVSACHRGQDGYRALLTAVGRVAEAGGDVDLRALYPAATTARIDTGDKKSSRTITMGGSLPRWPTAPVSPVTPKRVNGNSKRARAVASTSPILQAFFAETAATTAAHETFLRVAHESFALQADLLGHQQPQIPPATSRGARFERADCLEFAVGSIARVLGAGFSDVDHLPTRVRLPDEPLMLVDRVVAVEGTMGRIGPGRIVTEHDVHADAWYLDGGHAPICISVEAGQADLMLSAYLGIDRETRGERVYRLLDAKIRFHRDLPRPGERIRYDIRIDRFIQQGETWLFFFRFDGTIDGAPFITMFDGCAGFFSAEQLASGRGIVPRTPVRRAGDASIDRLVPAARRPLDDRRVEALRRGDAGAAFGAPFLGKTLTPAMRLPSGRMKLVDRIVRMDTAGGTAGLGVIVGEADVSPDAWYLTCHFIDDPVMPGTLMYECCLHTLRVLLLQIGWISTDPLRDVHYAPVLGIASELRCRGQVTRETKQVRYEVDVLELGYDPEPYVIARASMFADERHIVEMDGMSVRVVGLTRGDIERQWQEPLVRESAVRSGGRRFSRQQIVAHAEGNPSDCFGAPYAPFDSDRRLARLPRDPFLFVDRVVDVDAAPWVLEPTGWVTCELDVQEDAWYFSAHRQGTMPFAVLLEAALQPCGWLAAYLGSALRSESDLHFRNLDGWGTQLEEVTPTTGTLTTRARLIKTSEAGGMILQEFDVEILASGRRVYEGQTGFGFFPGAALAAQVGVRGAASWPNPTPVSPFELPRLPPKTPQAANPPAMTSGLALPGVALAMIDTIETLDLRGGSSGLGLVVGTKRIDPNEWFFRAHFYQDPVMPGSLGLDALLQLLKVFARERFPALATTHRFQTMACGVRHVWQYRGQVVPQNHSIRVEAEITSVTHEPVPLIQANGQLAVDGKIIYAMKDFAVGLIPTEQP